MTNQLIYYLFFKVLLNPIRWGRAHPQPLIILRTKFSFNINYPSENKKITHPNYVVVAIGGYVKRPPPQGKTTISTPKSNDTELKN